MDTPNLIRCPVKLSNSIAYFHTAR